MLVTTQVCADNNFKQKAESSTREPLLSFQDKHLFEKYSNRKMKHRVMNVQRKQQIKSFFFFVNKIMRRGQLLQSDKTKADCDFKN